MKILETALPPNHDDWQILALAHSRWSTATEVIPETNNLMHGGDSLVDGTLRYQASQFKPVLPGLKVPSLLVLIRGRKRLHFDQQRRAEYIAI